MFDISYIMFHICIYMFLILFVLVAVLLLIGSTFLTSSISY